MKKYLLFLTILTAGINARAQWQTPNLLGDLNTWSSQPGFIGWYNTAVNTPTGSNYGSGIQMVLPSDSRFGTQLVAPTFETNMYYRSIQAGTYGSWYTVWSSANLNNSTVNFLAKDISCTNVYTNGNVWAKQIQVALTNPWPDYVFKKDYQLSSLSEVKTYIDQNHHLPEIPSEQEIREDGLNLGDINRLLVKKVEELTLYLIRQKDQTDKQIEAQQQQINELKQQITKLIK